MHVSCGIQPITHGEILLIVFDWISIPFAITTSITLFDTLNKFLQSWISPTPQSFDTTLLLGLKESSIR